jgi:hypothetical protein
MDLLAAIDPYGENVVTPQHRAGMLCLWGFLLSFLFVRTSARMIRAQVKWWPGNVETSGGLHIHHLVWGIFTLLIAGFLGFAINPDSPWREVLAVFFGIGAGLTLDEYALWLRLQDVYWAEEGRQSITVVVFAATFGALIVLGLAPLDIDTASYAAIGASVAITLGFAAVAALKGKFYAALIGIFIPPASFVAAIRLAKPDSAWARRFYAEGSKKLERSRARFGRERRHLTRFENLIAGAPSEQDAERAEAEKEPSRAP